MSRNFNNRSVNTHQFSMIPRADIPRSRFVMESAHKTTFDSGYLVPVYVDEVLPGDQFSLDMTAFCRMSTPLFPIMDNMYLDTFFFFVPNRLVWDNWQRFMGEQIDPGDSVDFLIPQVETPKSGYAPLSLQDYMGLPTKGQMDADKSIEHSALFCRAYNLIYNEWFRDQNMQDSLPVPRTDGPDDPSDYVLQRRGKRHDYFTSALPWPQKGESAAIPLGGFADVLSTGPNNPVQFNFGGTLSAVSTGSVGETSPARRNLMIPGGSAFDNTAATWPSGKLPFVADLSDISSFTVNELRLSIQYQKMLERDARGGTRYTELVRSHFGVTSPDARLQRPEYLGGGSTPININAVAQTSATTIQGGDSPLGTLSAVGQAVSSNKGFTSSFTEHGMIIGLVSVRADLSYQQGMRRMFSRKSKEEFYFPVFANLGEQAILNKEIYVTGDPDNMVGDNAVFGYQERWAEYRYHPSMITGLFRSTTAQTVDQWHLSQRFTSLPKLDAAFIEDRPPLDRILAVGPSAAGQQFIFDSLFRVKATRPMPLYSVPGLMDHF